MTPAADADVAEIEVVATHHRTLESFGLSFRPAERVHGRCVVEGVDLLRALSRYSVGGMKES